MPTLRRVAAIALSGLPWLGCLCLLLAMRWYPGGSWWDQQAVGASFVDTFLCDLMAPRSVDGTANPIGGRLGQAGMALLVASLVPAWWLAGAPSRVPPDVPDHARPTQWSTNTDRRLMRTARVLGLAGLVPLSVSLATPGAWLHTVAIPGAGLVELTALALHTVAALRQPNRRATGIAGMAVIAALVVGLGFYWPTIWRGELAHRGLPAIQKLGVVALAAWMLAIARDARRQ